MKAKIVALGQESPVHMALAALVCLRRLGLLGGLVKTVV